MRTAAAFAIAFTLAAAHFGYTGNPAGRTIEPVEHPVTTTVYERLDFDRHAVAADVAQERADRLADRQQLYHQMLGTTDLLAYSDRVGEVVARCNGCSGDSVVDAWHASPRHDAQITDPAFTRVGVGVAESSSGRTYVVAVLLTD